MPWTLAWLSCCLASSTALPLDGGAWTFSNGAEFAGAKGALTTDAGTRTLHFDFTGGGAYVAAACEFTPAEVARFTLRVRKPADATLTFRVTDSTGQTLQKSGGWGGDAWQKIEVLNSGWSFSWGGAADGHVHGAIHAFALLIESRGLLTPNGALDFADVTAETGAPVADTGATTYLASDFGADSGWRGYGLKDGTWTYTVASATSRPSLGHSLSLFGRPQSLTVKADGGVAGQRLVLRLGSHFMTFERVLGTLTGGPVAFTVPAPPQGWKYYGGENDGQVHPPLRASELVVEGDAAAPRATLSHLELLVTTDIERRHGVVMVPSPGNSAAGGVDFSCRLVNVLPEELRGELAVEAVDFDGRPRHVDTQPLTLPAGRATVVTHTVPLPETPNYLGLRWTFVAGQVRAVGDATFTAPLPAGDTTTPLAPQPASPWGMGLYLGRDSFADMSRAAALGRQAGVRWTREDFSWQRLEPRQGQFDWSFYDQLVKRAGEQGISVYGLLGYWNNWTKPYTEEGIADYARYAKAVVTHYKDHIKHWEVWNEPNIFFWSGPKELYPKLLIAAYAAIKEADPEAEVLGCSTAGVDQAWIRKVVAAGAPFDVLTVHPYRATLEEGAFIAELRQASSAGRDKPVWITEMGWGTDIGATPEDAQARLLGRCYLSAVGSGASANISWYDFRDDGDDPFYFETNMGIVRRDFSPKPAYRALATVCGSLPGAKGGRRVDLGSGLWCFRYDTDRGPAWALWSSTTRLLRLGTDDGATVVDLMGGQEATHGDITRLLPARTPVLILGSGKLDLRGEPIKVEAPHGARAGETIDVTIHRGDAVETQHVTVPAGTPPGVSHLAVTVKLGEREVVWPLSVEVLGDVVRI